MRISAKGRYGLAAMIVIAQGDFDGNYVPVIVISEKLGLSKIYLEQVFSLLKRAGLVSSVKGAQGGYRLAKSPDTMSAYEILASLEQILFESTESSVEEQAPFIEQVMQTFVFDVLDATVKEKMEQITLSQLVAESNKFKDKSNFMFFI
ncbi:MAG: Rrf2 family transcriptional regulator [Eubacterium sp.]